MTKLIRLADISGDDVVDPPGEELRGGVVSIGNFDGVHRGHAALLGVVRSQANQLGGPAIAVVFDPHPAAILRPEYVPPKLTWLQRRAELLERIGIDFLVACETSREFLSLSPDAFFAGLVVRRLAAKAMVEGPNFFFGRGRSGDIQTLRRLCDQAEVGLSIVPPTVVDDEMISSTRIRELLLAGDVPGAVALLGHPYRVRGQVVGGDRRGREIGFPTANMDRVEGIIPAPGVYGGFACIGDQQRMAAIHIGPSPTFEDTGNSKLEVHVLDYAGDIYGSLLQVDLVTSVRDIARFDSVDQLKNQLARDVETIREQLTDDYLNATNDVRDHGKGK